MLIARFFDRLIRTGSVAMIDADGRRHEFGDGTGTPVTFRLHDRALYAKFLINPSLYVGEAFMDGTLTFEDGDLYALLDTATRNMDSAGGLPYGALLNWGRNAGRLIQQFNSLGRSRRNVAHHYDLSRDFYELFLDSDLQYSCAYFDHPGQSLEDAQHSKKRHIAAKLVLDRPGLKILDIGCGWGGLALYLAAETGAEVTGITLSEEQHKLASERAERLGLADKVSFHLRDFREETGTYDRIVSVGMFEHVGVPQFPAFFRKVHDLLAPDGVTLLHTIGRADGPGSTNPWIRKYIFPGGYAPALSEIMPVAEHQKLFVTDIEILRLHYAETLRAWRARFAANYDKAKALYDERFCRMWNFYLVGAELAFRNERQVVFQMQMTKDQEAVPLTRDYVTDWERSHTSGREHAA
jgi:cyclopropane-fatty-acyl-phospholipid synthase